MLLKKIHMLPTYNRQWILPSRAKKLLIPFVLTSILCLFFGSGKRSNALGKIDEDQIQRKATELISGHKKSGFVTYKSGQILARQNEEFPLYVHLIAGRWYHFVIVGNPDAKKISLRLGLPGLGDFITDRFKPEQTNEYWTEFSFVCPQSGHYLLTLNQKGLHPMAAHIAILQKPHQIQGQPISYQMHR